MESRVAIEVDGKRIEVPEGTILTRVLESCGWRISRYPEEGSLFAPCDVGGCWSCAVEVDGKIRPACTTVAGQGMIVRTDRTADQPPRRVVHGFSGHPVGGVGTPWRIKGAGRFVEVACFAAGCNLRCPQCQNWDIAYAGRGEAMTPEEAAEGMTFARKRFQVHRMALSGGECTLNRAWLVGYIKALKNLNPDEKARIHLDTNATILTRDYADELVEAGMTDVGPDLKGITPETFMGITGLRDRDLAEKYLDTSWEATRYLIEKHRGRVFVGVGIPYNERLISRRELELMGEKLKGMDPGVQITVLDYRPMYERPDLVKPGYGEMLEIHRTLTGKGLKTVICQTEKGLITPES